MTKSSKLDKKSEKGNESQSKSSDSSLLSKQWHHIPVVLIGVIGLVVLAGAVSVLVLISNDDQGGASEPVTAETTYADSGLTYDERAEQLDYSGNYDEAQSVLDEGISGSEDNQMAQADFYIKKTYIALNAGQFEDALESSLSADELRATTETAGLVAEAAEATGDSELAIEYWTLAADRTPEDEQNPESFNSEYGYYLQRIKELGGVYEE